LAEIVASVWEETFSVLKMDTAGSYDMLVSCYQAVWHHTEGSSSLCIIYYLQKIYARLNEPDAVHGIMATRGQEPSLEELIIAHEVTGQLQVYKNNCVVDIWGIFLAVCKWCCSFICSCSGVPCLSNCLCLLEVGISR
jgi:hypothetical protein